MTRLTLRPGRDRRVRGGHPWVFSNEISLIDGTPPPGEAVEVYAHRGEFLGTAYYNPHSLIAARILSRESESIDTAAFFRQRISRARDYRTSVYGKLNAVRLVHGEADGLPGLVIDRYGEVLSVQLLTAGMDRRRNLILEALDELFSPAAVIARNDVGVRELEGLPRQVELLTGQLPDRLVVTENGLDFRVDVGEGQKTGHFLDQKENHLALRGRVEGKRVLDLFCYSGSWSLHAARFGASDVTGVDISRTALALAEENARLNGVEERCSFAKADVFELLREKERSGERFGTVVLDPPAFVKSRKKLPEALRGYLTVNRRAMNLVEPGGFLFTCTCSHHLQREAFIDMLRQAAGQAGRGVRLLEIRGQAYDHPVLLSCPETEYLKCAVLQLL
ncbi:class I SAM-dependent rRNA methyltransferase [uncultured Desulfuromonas sp.]|uniref:class I SAM-dependent rRNA methyltransferase n=1 Tax=uncultured Desulfuromonas sp. TaxID=181013 RepID=UPI0026181169|nr:class I SAM-dependent rRNA methyltransferase [uncultured Desulfuromonas sp.]